jgi:hypothetical protein
MDKFLKMFGKSKKPEKVEKNEKHLDSPEIRKNTNMINTNIEQKQEAVEKKFYKTENTLTNTSNNFENNQTIETNSLHHNITLNTQTLLNISSSQTQAQSQLPSSFSLTQSNLEKANDVVLVNNPEDLQRSKLEGFYYKKYINKIQKLTISNPILVEREKMKINFDSEVMDYLVNDLTLIFREKQQIIDQNQVR